jgi:hypothetical protein
MTGRKKSNLEVNTGMVKSKNPSHSNVVVDISSLADATGIQLGVDSKSELESIAEMSKCETNRASMFRDNCEICKASSSVTSKGDSIVGKEVEREGDGDPHTPHGTMICLRWRTILHHMVSGLWW